MEFGNSHSQAVLCQGKAKVKGLMSRLGRHFLKHTLSLCINTRVRFTSKERFLDLKIFPFPPLLAEKGKRIGEIWIRRAVGERKIINKHGYNP